MSRFTAHDNFSISLNILRRDEDDKAREDDDDDGHDEDNGNDYDDDDGDGSKPPPACNNYSKCLNILHWGDDDNDVKQSSIKCGVSSQRNLCHFFGS